MKKDSIFGAILALALLFAGSVFAAESTTTFTTGSAQVVCTSCTLLNIVPIGGDSAANTETARSVTFYNNVSVRVSSHPHTDVIVFTWVYAPGQFSTDVPQLGPTEIHSKWGGTVFEGYDFSSGLVISPTASEKYMIQYWGQ